MGGVGADYTVTPKHGARRPTVRSFPNARLGRVQRVHQPGEGIVPVPPGWGAREVPVPDLQRELRSRLTSSAGWASTTSRRSRELSGVSASAGDTKFGARGGLGLMYKTSPKVSIGLERRLPLGQHQGLLNGRAFDGVRQRSGGCHGRNGQPGGQLKATGIPIAATAGGVPAGPNRSRRCKFLETEAMGDCVATRVNPSIKKLCAVRRVERRIGSTGPALLPSFLRSKSGRRPKPGRRADIPGTARP